MHNNKVDIKENDIINYSEQLLPQLLVDNSSKRNIIWATDIYANYGDSYASTAQILIPLISGQNGDVIKPRVNKNKEEQLLRVRDKAEVFTPSWICNKQNNLVDNAWFGVDDIFNTETSKGWESLSRPVPFELTDGKTWQDYVKDVRLEITCGEAPYLVSRYDTISGLAIAISNRVGLLDRKLRVVSENTNTENEWYEWAKVAFQSTYGYEWQGDSLLLARENLLFTFIDYYKEKFTETPSTKQLLDISKIISWNIWQMDGLKCVIPNSCCESKVVTENLFDSTETLVKCEGCSKNDMQKHNGMYCKIKDWKAGKTLKFVSLLKNK